MGVSVRRPAVHERRQRETPAGRSRRAGAPKSTPSYVASACVVYASGMPVVPLVPGENLFFGPSKAEVIQGKCAFKLKMGPSILSQRHGEQKFRVRVWPVELAAGEEGSGGWYALPDQEVVAAAAA